MDEAEARKRYINEPVTPYGLSNPHPLYNKDPNIMNEFGHTHYPKWVYPNGTNNAGVLANDAKHEKEIFAEHQPKEVKPQSKEVEKHFDPPMKTKNKTWDE